MRFVKTCAVAEIVKYWQGIGSVQRISHDNNNMKKCVQKWCPRFSLLNNGAQVSRINICSDIMKTLETDPKILRRVIIYDESWFFTYYPWTKQQSMHWKNPNSPRHRKLRWANQNSKPWWLHCFDIQGNVYEYWVPKGHGLRQCPWCTVSQKDFGESSDPQVRWERGLLSPNLVSIIKAFFIWFHPLLEHPPYSLDLAPCGFIYASQGQVSTERNKIWDC